MNDSTTVTGKRFTTQRLALMAMFAAILCVSAYISVPLPFTGYHVTFLNFIITLIALVFPLEQSLLISVVWLLLGAVGVPVFIGGNAGIGYLMGPLGGYTIAFILVALLLPLLRGAKYNRIRGICYICRFIWYGMAETHEPYAMENCMDCRILLLYYPRSGKGCCSCTDRSCIP